MTNAVQPLTVGAVARLAGITVRTLHHYDETGLLVPSERSAAGYRAYTPADVQRLQRILFYRELELPLDRIHQLIDDPEADERAHLRRQRWEHCGQHPATLNHEIACGGLGCWASGSNDCSASATQSNSPWRLTT